MRRHVFLCVIFVVTALTLLACQQQTTQPPEQKQGAGRSERAATQPQRQPVTLPAGTVLKVSLLDRLSSDDNKAGDIFHATVVEPLSHNGKAVIPKDARVWGKVTNTVKSGRLKQRAELWVTLTSIQAGEKKYDVATSTAGEKEGSKGKRDILLIGGGAGAGAAVGGATGGGKGAGIGAAIGAGAGTAVAALTGKRDIVYPPETIIQFTLSQAVTIRQ